MISIQTAMTALRDRLAYELGPGARPVLVDPTKTASTPCVLIETPQIEPAGTLCGEVTYRHSVLVIGQPGAWAELAPLSELTLAVLAALDEMSVGWTLAEPVAYVPLVQDGQADPCMSYRITVEEYS